MSTSVSAVYLNVVDAVVSKLREEFISEGVDDSVLNELQQLWEMKMLHCGVIQGPIERNSAPRAAVPTPVHDLNVPYEGLEEYETPTAEMLFPPTPLQTPMQTPLPVDTPGYQYFPSGSSEYAGTPDVGPAPDMKQGQPSPYMQQPSPSPWTNQRPLGVDVNVAYEEAREEEEGGGGGAGGSGSSNTNSEGVIQVSQPPMTDFFMMTSGKRKRDDYASNLLPGGYIPQQDGADTVGDKKVSAGVCLLNKPSPSALFDHLKFHDRESADAEIALMIKNKQSTIPQHDGFPDAYDEGVGNEGYNTPAYCDSLAAHIAGTPKIMKSEALEDDEPPLNEDDDDDEDLDDLEQGDEEPSTNHLVLAQFEKVSRTKSRWKCTLKDGVMHLNNKDILFTKANGEFEF